MTLAIWIALIVLAIYFINVFTRDFLSHKKVLEKVSWLKTSIIGFVVNFFDVLGIGAFASQTALLNFTKQMEDPRAENILFAGTDLGVYVSVDSGKQWEVALSYVADCSCSGFSFTRAQGDACGCNARA